MRISRDPGLREWFLDPIRVSLFVGMKVATFHSAHDFLWISPTQTICPTQTGHGNVETHQFVFVEGIYNALPHSVLKSELLRNLTLVSSDSTFFPVSVLQLSDRHAVPTCRNQGVHGALTTPLLKSILFDVERLETNCSCWNDSVLVASKALLTFVYLGCFCVFRFTEMISVSHMLVVTETNVWEREREVSIL